MPGTRITIWLEKGKPTRVKKTKAEQYYVDDVGKVLDILNQSQKESENANRKRTGTEK